MHPSSMVVHDPRFNMKNKTRINYLIQLQDRQAHLSNLKKILNGRSREAKANRYGTYNTD